MEADEDNTASTEAREAAPKNVFGGDTWGESLSQVGNLSQLIVLTMGSV